MRRLLPVLLLMLLIVGVVVAWPRSGVEDEDGVKVEQGGVVPEGEAPRLAGRSPAEAPGTGPTASTPSAGTAQKAQGAEAWIPLRLRLVDGDDGGEIPGGRIWAVRSRRKPLRPGHRGALDLKVEVPQGYVAWESRTVHATISRWADSVEVVYPARREAHVEVSLLDHVGAAAPGARVESFEIGSRRVTSVAVEAVRDGTLRLRGVPHFRAALLRVTASHPGSNWMRRKTARLPEHPGEAVHLTIAFPDPYTEPEDTGEIGIGGGAGGRFGTPGRKERPTGVVEVQVIRYDGTPAAHAKVWVGRHTGETDATGTVVFDAVAAGERRVTTQEPGLLPTSAVILVEEGRTQDVRLVEGEGGRLDVRVQDDKGRGIPFAAIDLRLPSRERWVDEYQGVQRIDPFTDEDGRRRFERVETGRVEVRATWGDRFGKVTVDVAEGLERSATITLKRGS